MYIVEDEGDIPNNDNAVSIVVRENSMFKVENLGEYLPKIITKYADVRAVFIAILKNPENNCTLQLSVLDNYRNSEPKLNADEAVATIDIVNKDNTINRFWCPLKVWREALGYEVHNQGKTLSEIF